MADPATSGNAHRDSGGLTVLLAVPVGLAIGIALGALGGGGSILTVPALVYLLGQSAHAATSGALVIVGLSAGAGMLAQLRSGRVRVRTGLVFGLLGIVGSYLGSRASTRVDPNVLLAAFAVLLAAAASAMLRRRPEPTSASESSGATGGRRRGRESAAMVATATAVGFLTGFFGVGGGFVIVPALVLVLGFEMPTAVGTSLLIITINSATALANRLPGLSQLDWPLLAAFTVAAIAGTLGGHRLAGRFTPLALSRAFALLCLAVAGYVAARSLPPLLSA